MYLVHEFVEENFIWFVGWSLVWNGCADEDSRLFRSSGASNLSDSVTRSCSSGLKFDIQLTLSIEVDLLQIGCYFCCTYSWTFMSGLFWFSWVFFVSHLNIDAHYIQSCRRLEAVGRYESVTCAKSILSDFFRAIVILSDLSSPTTLGWTGIHAMIVSSDARSVYD